MTTGASASTMATASPKDLDLTTARIRRAARRTRGPAINEETAREDAAIVHQIIACVRQAYAIDPTHPGWCGGENETVETILRTVGGVSPKDHDDACFEGEWMMFQLTHAEKLTGGSDIYRRWLRVVGHIENFDYENLFEDERPSDDPSVDGVTFEEEIVLEDNDDDDDGHRQRTGRRRRPRLHLVTEPEHISGEEMTRRFLSLMGGVEPTSGNDRPRRRRPRLRLVTRLELTSADDLTRLFLKLMEDSS
jgi:hypothetical protein